VFESQVATAVEVGGGIREYCVAGVPILDGYREQELCPGAAGMVLAPWPNRIRNGRYEFAGHAHQLALTEPERGNAIHGLVRWQSWNVRRHGPADVELFTTIHPQPGYPFSVALSVRWLLDAEGLRATHTAVNTGADACPFGLATHPYIGVPGEPVDALSLALPAAHVLETDASGIPIVTRPVAETDLDYRKARRIGGAKIDSAFKEFERGADGRARMEVRGPRGGGAVLWMDSSFPYVQVFTGDTLDRPRWRRAIAVEPMTCPADAFRSGEGRIVLAPHEMWQGSWGITPL
jgi:aldose 1-epimerase